MARENINYGDFAEDGTGDKNRVGWEKSNNNFIELYNRLDAAEVAIDLNTAKVSSQWEAVTGGIRYVGGVAIGTENPTALLHISGVGGALVNLQTTEPGSIATPASRKIIWSSHVNTEQGSIDLLAQQSNTNRADMLFSTMHSDGMVYEDMRLKDGDMSVNGHISYDTAIINLAANTTLNATHKNKIVECDGTFTVTLPNSMPIGYKVDITNIGTGTITLAATGTLHTKNGNILLASRYIGISAYHQGSNVWIAVGDLS